MSFKNMLIINKPLKSPGFKHYFILSFITAFLFIIQDGLYRSESLLSHMRLHNLLNNIVIFIGLAFYFFIVVGILFFALDMLYIFINNFMVRLSHKSNENEQYQEPLVYCRLSNFLYFVTNIYIFLIYLKLFLNTTLISMRFNDPISKSVLLTFSFLIVLIVLYFFYFRFRLEHIRIAALTEKYFPYVALFVLVAWFGSILVSSEWSFTLKQPASARSGKNRPHILIITADGMKYGSMSAPGNEKNLTPNISKFASKADVFTKNLSYSNGTPVCLSTIELGTLSPNGPVTESLSYILGENGYDTRIFASQFSGVNVSYYTDHISLNEPCHYDQLLKEETLTSFSSWVQKVYSEDDRFYNILSTVDPREVDYTWKNPETENHLHSIVYAMKKSPTPVFVWLHMLETHIPFHYPERFNKYNTGLYKELDKYDNSILYFDYLFKELMEELKKEKLDENTLIIFSADHGIRQIPQEAYPSYTYTAQRFADSVYHTPLIIKFPGQQKGRVFNNFTSSLDLRPTIFDYLDITDVSEGEGESLMPLIRGDKNTTDIKACISQVFINEPENRDPGITNACEDVVNVYWKKYLIMLHKPLLRSIPPWKQLYEQALQNNNVPFPCQIFPPAGLDKIQTEDREPVPFKGFQCIGIFDVSGGWKSKVNLLYEDEGKKVLQDISTAKLDELLRIPGSRNIR
ncbi:MAG: sulfatase-like hydrolase/transferase [Firmicutes bacterium]|nr:sulfatase-like hydrolase/transferase [Bacillota bacterium]